MHRPRLIIAGLNGGSGKTTVSLGLARAWARAGKKVVPFKKGPDYIDAVWLGLAAGNTASNLDPFLMHEDMLRALFWRRAFKASACCIEGNRGLFDGKDLEGSCSTAELARIINTPVILVMDCTKMTRTAAAIVAGCKDFEPGVNIAGVILNRVAGKRHREISSDCIIHYTGVPVLGALPKVRTPIPERHMGLISNQEHEGQEEILDGLADLVTAHCDMDGIWSIAQSAPDEPRAKTMASLLWPEKRPAPVVRIGVIRDAALWFYYEENIEALRRAGGEVIELSLLDNRDWPEIGGLYLGGGFPETMADSLAKNTRVRQRVRQLSEMGMPIYAECGGFMYLCEGLIYQGNKYPMAGVFPVTTKLHERPQGLGYVEATVVHDNPFHPAGEILRGHEFHYSRCLTADGTVLTLSLKLDRGQGVLAGLDGLLHKQTFAAYTHLHALGTPHWAPNFIQAAQQFRQGLLD